jgi:hypothetical protein
VIVVMLGSLPMPMLMLMLMPASASSVARHTLAGLSSGSLKMLLLKILGNGKTVLGARLVGYLFVSFGQLGCLDSDDDSLLCLTKLADLEEVRNAVVLRRRNANIQDIAIFLSSCVGFSSD